MLHKKRLIQCYSMHHAEGIMDTVSDSHNLMFPSTASDTTDCRPLVGCSRSRAPSASSTVLIYAGTPRGASHSRECSKRPHLPSALSTQAHRGSATKGAKPYHRPVMLNHGVGASFFPSPPTSAILHARHDIKKEHAVTHHFSDHMLTGWLSSESRDDW